jgi:membrane fusion protein, multidrug efflux system
MVCVKILTTRTLVVAALSASLVACGFGHDKKKKDGASAQALPVTVLEIKKQPVEILFQSVGSFFTTNSPIVKAQTTGEVKSINVQAGAEVKKGDLLVQLGDKRAEIEYQKALASQNEKQYIEERYKKLAAKGIVSQVQYQQALASLKVAQQGLLAAKENVDRAKIDSPIDGHVEQIYVSVGDLVSPGSKVASVVNSKMLEARLPFSQSQVSMLKIGQAVEIFSPTSPDYVLKGSIDAITPSINPENRSFDVIVKFSNAQNVWRIGASNYAAISLEEKGTGYFIPKESIVLGNGGEQVFVARNGKAVEIKDIKILSTQGQMDAIDAPGLKEGDLIIVDGAPYLSNGSAITIQGKKPTPAAATPSKAKAPATKKSSTTSPAKPSKAPNKSSSTSKPSPTK